jgi:TP53 regulating kinase-like protein
VRNGVRVPDVRVVDVESGIIVMEWIEGNSVRHLLGSDEEEKDEKVFQAESLHSLQSFSLTEGKQTLNFSIRL